MTRSASPAPPHPIARVFVPFACGDFVSYFFRTVNAVLSPDQVRELRLDAADLGLLASAYFLALAAGGRARGRDLRQRTQPAGAGGGRALIGVGVSACLMASIKAFTQWFPLARLATANGWLTAAGGVGAIAASAPLEALLRLAAFGAGFTSGAPLAWFLFALLAPSASLAYAIQTRRYPASLAGRVNTAVNLLVFTGAFAAQWGVGIVVDLWPAEGSRHPAAAYGAAFYGLAALECAALAWLYLAPPEPGT